MRKMTWSCFICVYWIYRPFIGTYSVSFHTKWLVIAFTLMRHNKMKTWSLEIWKVDNKNHLVLLTTASPEQFYICHSIHSISETSQGASGIKAYCPSWNILHRLMTEYCIISHSFSPESRLCTYHILLPPAKPMQSDDIVQHLMHEMLAHLRPQSIITDCKTSYCM